MKTGRKSLKEELGVLERYNQLSPKAFKFVNDMFDSEILEDRKWAADWLKPAFAKMIPQKVHGDDDHPFTVKTIIINKNELPDSSNRPLSQTNGSLGSV